MKSTEFLQAAIDVQAERGKQYDKPTGERSMAATVSAFNCITGSMLEESDGWMLLGLLKLVRQAQNPEQYHHDSALDFVAYASLYAEAASEQCGQAGQDAHIGYKEEEPSDIPSRYDWRDAEDKYNWLVTDREGAFWFVNEPHLKPHGQTWEYPGNTNMKTIHEVQQPLAKYKRPTSTAK
jgi:hypothetical protein